MQTPVYHWHIHAMQLALCTLTLYETYNTLYEAFNTFTCTQVLYSSAANTVTEATAWLHKFDDC